MNDLTAQLATKLRLQPQVSLLRLLQEAKPPQGNYAFRERFSMDAELMRIERQTADGARAVEAGRADWTQRALRALAGAYRERLSARYAMHSVSLRSAGGANG